MSYITHGRPPAPQRPYPIPTGLPNPPGTYSPIAPQSVGLTTSLGTRHGYTAAPPSAVPGVPLRLPTPTPALARTKLTYAFRFRYLPTASFWQHGYTNTPSPSLAPSATTNVHMLHLATQAKRAADPWDTRTLFRFTRRLQRTCTQSFNTTTYEGAPLTTDVQEAQAFAAQCAAIQNGARTTIHELNQHARGLPPLRLLTPTPSTPPSKTYSAPSDASPSTSPLATTVFLPTSYGSVQHSYHTFTSLRHTQDHHNRP